MSTNRNTLTVKYLVSDGSGYLTTDSGAAYFTSLRNAKYFENKTQAIDTALQAAKIGDFNFNAIRILQVKLDVIQEYSLASVRKAQLEAEMKEKEMEIYILSQGDL